MVEILIVMVILVMLVMTAIGMINPTILSNKAYDAQRKKDLARMKVAFEEYYNDKQCYPSQAIADQLMQLNSCSSAIFSPWLNSWPCDPQKIPYHISVEQTGCPKWFMIFANLLNKNDSDIPPNWVENVNYHVGNGEVSNKQVNYGVSSTNVNWYTFELASKCLPPSSPASCGYEPSGPDSCNTTDSCVGPNCFMGNCLSDCDVPCCNGGQLCGM